MAKNNITSGWPCLDECTKIPLKVTAMVMNECGITAEEYMADREKWLRQCGVWEDKNG